MTNRTHIDSYGPNNEVVVERVDDNDGIYIVSLNDPDTFNTMTVALMKAVAEAFDAISARANSDPNKDEVRAIVFRGEGRGFAIGLDIGKLDEYLEGGISGRTDPWRAIWDCP